MNHKGIAFGDLFKIISEGNTAIIHYSSFIIHLRDSATNGNWHNKTAAERSRFALCILGCTAAAAAGAVAGRAGTAIRTADALFATFSGLINAKSSYTQNCHNHKYNDNINTAHRFTSFL